jgi:hypothetical protein
MAYTTRRIYPARFSSFCRQIVGVTRLSVDRGLSLSENAHLFALMNVAMADAAIACWDGKYRYVFWRPITAIREGLSPADADPDWIPWLDFFPSGTPAHPENPSGHSTLSGSAAFVLAAEFGENAHFSATSDVRPGTRHLLPRVMRARQYAGRHSGGLRLATRHARARR